MKSIKDGRIHLFGFERGVWGSEIHRRRGRVLGFEGVLEVAGALRLKKNQGHGHHFGHRCLQCGKGKAILHT